MKTCNVFANAAPPLEGERFETLLSHRNLVTRSPVATFTSRSPMITVANRIFVDPSFAEQFETRFRERAGLVDRMQGFISNQVLRPVNAGDPYVVMTLWARREDFVAWTESDEFRQGHARSGTLPKEAFTAPNKLEVHEVFLDSSRPDLEDEPPGGPMRFH
jgi:heme-degrading monooxygenase HmoA